jgi:hypothetical protein
MSDSGIESTRVNESSEITIPLRNLLALVFATGVAVMFYFQITERLNFLEHNSELLTINVEANSEFRTLWPRGELGSLPDDAKQNRAQERMNRRLGEAASSGATFGLADELGGGLRGLVGAQTTPREEGTTQNAARERLNERLRQALLNAGR